MSITTSCEDLLPLLVLEARETRNRELRTRDDKPHARSALTSAKTNAWKLPTSPVLHVVQSPKATNSLGLVRASARCVPNVFVEQLLSAAY